MPIVAIELTDHEAARLDEVAKREKRVRKYQASISLMERVDAVLAADAETAPDKEVEP